ncbi:collagen alpha-1(I) chain-like [Eubalaena glacialis]|uniref:collagen alpha-1(I) chain-like n=1 Tax=Eubalaena glacialis TaxID=27606 RepID=UPI002A59D19A|nr:collagen alpha-1(I) chain-like [Eubalaena glacialis]
MTQAGSATGQLEVSGHLCSFPSVQPFLPACQDTGPLCRGHLWGRSPGPAQASRGRGEWEASGGLARGLEPPSTDLLLWAARGAGRPGGPPTPLRWSQLWPTPGLGRNSYPRIPTQQLAARTALGRRVTARARWRRPPQQRALGASSPPRLACFPCQGPGDSDAANPTSSLLQRSAPAGRGDREACAVLQASQPGTQAPPRIQAPPGPQAPPGRTAAHHLPGANRGRRVLPNGTSASPGRRGTSHAPSLAAERRAEAATPGSQPRTIDSPGTSAEPGGTINGLSVPGAGDTPVRAQCPSRLNGLVFCQEGHTPAGQNECWLSQEALRQNIPCPFVFVFELKDVFAFLSVFIPLFCSYNNEMWKTVILFCPL